MISKRSFYQSSSYEEILNLQQLEFNKRINCKKNGLSLPGDVVFFVEHKPVYTLGRHGNISNLLMPEEELERKGIEFVHLQRGGDITYHGPGQLTVYPILDLQKYRLGIKGYINLLEETVILSLAEYGLRGERIEGKTGVWITDGGKNPRKISAIGVYCSRFVTMHGFAFNIGEDISYFNGIVPCGLSQGVTSLSRELGKSVELNTVEEVVWQNLRHLLLLHIPAQEIF